MTLHVEPQKRRSALQAWYRVECNKQAGTARSLATEFKRHIVILNVSLSVNTLLGIVAIILVMLHWQGELLFSFLILILIVALSVRILVAVDMWKLVKEHRHAFEKAKKAGTVQNIVRPALPDVWRIVEALAAAMGIKREMMTLWYSSERSVSASVQVDDRGRVDLVIPSGLAVIASREPARAEVILAHELGHARQADSELIRLNAIYGRAAELYLGLLVLGAVFTLAGFTFSGDFSLAQLSQLSLSAAPFVLVHSVQRRARLGMQRAEELADVAAATYADAALCATMLRDIGSNGSEAGDDLGAYRFDRWQRFRKNTTGLIDWGSRDEPIPPNRRLGNWMLFAAAWPTPAIGNLDRRRIIGNAAMVGLIVLLIDLPRLLP